MLLWVCLAWLTMAGVGFGGELAGEDSWLLMVEAGRDGPGRRITPKSVFIAPAIRPRAERCHDGFRQDHLGRCVKVVRVNPHAQLELLLKRLQSMQPPPTPVQPPSPSGPIRFSLELPEEDVAPTTPSTQPPDHPTTPSTLTGEDYALATTPITLVTRETKDSSASTESEPETIPNEVQTTPSTTKIVEYTTIEGSGVGEGSGEISSTTMNLEPSSEGSGFIETTESPEVTLTFEGSGSTEESSSEITPPFEISTENLKDSTEFSMVETTTEQFTEATPRTEHSSEEVEIPPNRTTGSLLLEILKGVEVQKASDLPKSNDSTTTLLNEQNDVNKSSEVNVEEQLPIIEYVDLVLPEKEELSSKEVKEEKYLIPLEDIRFNLTEKENELSPVLSKRKEQVVFIDPPVPPLPPIEDETPRRKYVTRVTPKSSVVTERTFENQNFREKFADSWWTETLPFDPAWVRFPDTPQPRKGLRPLKNRHRPSTPIPLQPRFRFPEEMLDPEHRPVVLKFWSRIPIIKETETQKRYQSDEDQWTAP